MPKILIVQPLEKSYKNKKNAELSNDKWRNCYP